jgi:hypothetical protein
MAYFGPRGDGADWPYGLAGARRAWNCVTNPGKSFTVYPSRCKCWIVLVLTYPFDAISTAA